MSEFDTREKTSDVEMENPEAFAKDDNGEDLLLVQIDAFRDKAKKLQTLINARERKVKELEALVRAKEAKNIELQDSLAKQQAEADSLVRDLNKRVDDLMNNIQESMADMQERLKTQVDATEDISTKQTKAVQETLKTMNDSLNDIKDELSDKVHSENVKVYRNIQGLMSEMDKSETINEKVGAGFKGISGQNLFLMLLGFANLGAIICMILLQLGII